MPWEISGNSGTSAAQHFLGTTDAQAFSIRVNNKRALRIEAQAAPNLIGGHESNLVAPGVEGATIAGGGADGSPNSVDANFGSIGGGSGNQTSGLAATVPGGEGNAAGGDFSFAAGRRAKANHAGTFVWADANDSDFISTADNQFLIQATGGVGIGTPTPNQALTIQSTSDTHLNVRANDGEQELLLGAESTGGIVATATNHALHLRAGGANPMLSIQPNGNVGIGTVSPSQALEVNGVVKAKDFIKGATPLVSSQWNDNAGGINYTGGNVGIGTNAPGAKLVLDRGFNESKDTSSLLIRHNGDSPISPAFVLQNDQGGEVNQVFLFGENSIPSLGPNREAGRIFATWNGLFVRSVKLVTIQGDCEITGNLNVRDTRMHVPDYVFESDYPLLSLDELRTYVAAEKHLPNVPDAKQIAQGGLNLTKFQMKLLEKTEELTLYTLAQDEQLQTQQQEIERLQQNDQTKDEQLETLQQDNLAKNEQLATMQQMVSLLQQQNAALETRLTVLEEQE